MKTMRTKLVILLALSYLVLISFGCSRRRNEVTNPNSPHVAGWLDLNSANFHGILVQRDGGPFVCTGCHAVSTTDSSSFCFKCHYGPSGRYHLSAWTDSSSQGFHGRYVLKQKSTTFCQECHGQDYRGGFSGRSCYECHNYYPHPGTWTDTLQDYYHGNVVERYGYDACKVCHGDTSVNFNGGRVSVSCLSCHTASVHGFNPNRWKFTSTDFHFHGNQVGRTGFVPCATCHGANYDYSKGGTHKGCATGCHGDPSWKQYGAVAHYTAQWAQGDTLGPDTTHAFWVVKVQNNDTTTCNHCHYPTTHSWLDGRMVPNCKTCHRI
jgi:hypothetical protein